jgi:small-conductance mechanosensitive channel
VTFVVPNSQVITKPVRNWHFTRTFGAIPDIFISVPFETNPEHVRKLMFEVLDESMNILKNPHPIVWLDDFLENGFQFRVRGYITADKVADLYEVASEVRLALTKRLRENGISLAVPTRVINIDQAAQISALKEKKRNQQANDKSKEEE